MRAIPFVIALASLALSMPARAGVIDVPGDQQSISLAVGAASDGDTIRIGKGRWSESIATNLSLKFIGENGTIWDGFYSGSNHDQLTVNASHVIVQGIEFENGEYPVTITGDDASVTKCRFSADEDAGLKVTGARAIVSNNVFQFTYGSDYPITIVGPDARVEKNSIIDCDYAGIQIDAMSSGSATVTGNVLDTCASQMTIIVLGASSPTITNNKIRTGYCGGNCIDLVNCDDAEIHGNQISQLNYDVEAGISVVGAHAHVTDNVLEDLDAFNSDISVITVKGADASIVKNQITNCVAGELSSTYGINVAGDRARVEKNTIKYLDGGGNYTYGVNIVGNDCTVSGNHLDHFANEYTFGAVIAGDRAVVKNNAFSHMMYETTVYVTGDDFTLVHNDVRNGAEGSIPFYVVGNSTAPDRASISRNTVFNIANGGALVLYGSGVTLAKNHLQHIAGPGFEIIGDNNALDGNTVVDAGGDGFEVDGTANIFTKCTVTNSGRDGFDIGVGLFNVFANCKATNCSAEGFDNGGGEGTIATNCTFKKSRIDYAGNGGMQDDTGTVFGSGGALTAPEID